MRRAALAGTIALLATATPLVVAAPAGARGQREIVVRTGAEVKQSYDPIAGSAPISTAAEPTPDDCQGSGALQGACDVVPVKIVTPEGITDAEDWSVTLTITWRPDGNSDDLDVFLYDDRQVARRTDPDSTTYTQLGQSATSMQPEVIKLFKPDLGTYNLVVLHWVGSNLGYTVAGKINIGEAFTPPFEAIGDSSGGRSGSRPKDDDEPPPVDRSDESVPAFDQPPDSGGGPTLDTVAILPDSDLDSFDLSDFDDQLAAPVVPLSLPPGLRTSATRAGPVPAVVLLFWFGVVPIALLGSLFYLVVRRNRAAFSFG